MSGRPWTTGELAYMVEMAGKVPEAAIAKNLGRTTRAVESMAWRMNRQGTRVNLKRYEPRVGMCSRCMGPMDEKRGLSGLDNGPRRPAKNVEAGVCLACWIGERADVYARRTEEAIASAPIELRERLRQTRRLKGQNRKPAPPRPEPPYIRADEPWPKRKRAEERHQIALEDWAAEVQRRRLKAAQKRYERVVQRISAFKNPSR